MQAVHADERGVATAGHSVDRLCRCGSRLHLLGWRYRVLYVQADDIRSCLRGSRDEPLDDSRYKENAAQYRYGALLFVHLVWSQEWILAGFAWCARLSLILVYAKLQVNL